MCPDPIIIRSHKRKRTVALHVEPDGQLTIMAPMRTSLRWINAFIAEKALWIERRRREVKARAHIVSAASFEDGSSIPFQGKIITLIIHKMDRNDAPASCFDEKTACLRLNIPSSVPDEILKDEVKTEVALWYKKQARRIIPERGAYWVEQTGLIPSRFIVTGPQKRWGSCNSENEVRLNWRLVMAAPELLDYVIVHELCHIPHKDHSRRFWALVEKFVPQSKKIRQHLRIFEKSSPFSSNY